MASLRDYEGVPEQTGKSAMDMDIKKVFILVGSMVLLSVASFAQKKVRTQTINFEDQLVEGELRKPELIYLLQKKQFNFGRLIKLRENFLPELRRTSEKMVRGE